MKLCILSVISMGDKDVNGSSTINELLSMVSYDQWVLVNPSGVRPSGRYKVRVFPS